MIQCAAILVHVGGDTILPRCERLDRTVFDALTATDADILLYHLVRRDLRVRDGADEAYVRAIAHTAVQNGRGWHSC